MASANLENLPSESNNGELLVCLHRVLEDESSSKAVTRHWTGEEGDETLRIYTGFGPFSDFGYLSGFDSLSHI